MSALVSAALRLSPACLVRKRAMTRWTMRNTGVSNSACTAKRMRSPRLRHLYLYYLPATVGVTAHLTPVASEPEPMLVTVSSAIAMAAAGLLVQGLAPAEAGDV